MPRIVKAEIAQDLTDLFPVLEPVSLSPTSLSSELMPVHLLLPGTHKFRSMVNEAASGAAGAINATLSFTPSDRYRYVVAACAFHTDGVARNIAIWLMTAAGPQQCVADSQAITAITAGTVIANALKRTLLLPPGYTLGVRTDVIGAGGVVTIQATYVEHRLLEQPPGV